MDSLDKKKKIGVITFHNAINYGAILQSFALHRWIREKGIDCEIIDYECEKFKNDYNSFRIYDKSLKGFIAAVLKTPINYVKKRKIKKFIKKYLFLSEEKYDKNNIIKANDIYDMFITGSDQVWNLPLTGYDKNYLLNFANKDKFLCSYAASMGNTSISEQDKIIFHDELSRYNYISVREDNAKDVLKKIVENNIVRVADPVFLIDASNWKKLSKTMKKDRYILIYLLHEKSIYKIADRMAKLLNIKIIAIQNNFDSPIPIKKIHTAGIEEFITYIQNAEVLITDSFHGIALGIIFRKNLRIVLKKDMKFLNARIETLVKELGLHSSVVSDESSDKELILKTEYNKIEDNIRKYIEDSRKYIENFLEDLNDHQ